MTSAIGRYHDLLTPEMAAASHAMLEDQLRRRGLFFGDRALCTVLRPRLFTAAGYRTLQARVAVLLKAFDAAYRAAMADASVREQFRLEAWEEEMVQVDPGFAPGSPHSRLDAFIDDQGGMALTEYNAETPAGAAYSDALTEVFLDLPVMQAFARSYEIRPMPARHGVYHVLMDAWRQCSGGTQAPSIAIIDWAGLPTASEFVLFERYFRDLGLDVQILTPDAVEYTNGRLWGGGRAIDVIYKRILLHELVGEGGLTHPIVRAVRDRAVCMVNPFRCKMLHKKASLAVLTDERNAGLFSPDEQAAIRAHVPWTRVVEARMTRHDGRRVDLLPFIAGARERMVLKPNDDYGGAGIVLGWLASDEEWQAAIRRALDSPYIVQERVAIASEPYPSMVDGQIRLIDRMLDTAPFCCYGTHDMGCLTRLSTAALLNVTAGGGSTVPVFVVEPR